MEINALNCLDHGIIIVKYYEVSTGIVMNYITLIKLYSDY